MGQGKSQQFCYSLNFPEDGALARPMCRHLCIQQGDGFDLHIAGWS
jgi:hypothetical protein